MQTCNDNISVFFLNGLFGQCTDSDGCAVDRATAWCEMTDTVYYRSVTVFLCTWRIWWGVTCVCCPSLQIEPPVIPGGVAGWGERRSAGGHDVGDADVPVWKEGNPSKPGKAATEQLKPHGKCEARHWGRQKVTELRFDCWEACYVAHDSRVTHLPLGQNSEAVMSDQLPFSTMQVWRLKIAAIPLHQLFLSP